jgi:hypothetical protein
LIGAVAVLGAVILLNVKPSVFIVDDINYLVTALAAREGHVTVANTAGLTPSRELLFFDPQAETRRVLATPIAPATPPLYGIVAAPLTFAGWRGLVSLNTVSFLVTILLVFSYTRAYADESATPWVAAGRLRVWRLCARVCARHLAACVQHGPVHSGDPAGRPIDRDRPRPAGAGCRTASRRRAGVRYQNAAIAGATFAGVVLLAPGRWRLAAAFAAGASLPLALSSWINHVRLDSWNPISKGLDISSRGWQPPRSHHVDAVTMLWAQLIDYSVRPTLSGPNVQWLSYGSVTGAPLIVGVTVKKAFLQSAPWAVLALVMLVACWRTGSASSNRRATQLRLFSLVTAALLTVFSFAGTSRHDGLAFNQRYLLELLPLAAVAFAWALDGRLHGGRGLGEGILVGAGIVLAIVLKIPSDEPALLAIVRHLVILKLPMVLAAAVLVAWCLEGRHRVGRWLLPLVGVCIGWGFSLHLAEDLSVSQVLRAVNLSSTEEIGAVVPTNSALVTHWGASYPAAALLLTRDIVVVDAHADGGQSTSVLIKELLAKGRRVFVLEGGFPEGMVQKISEGLKATPVPSPTAQFLELRSQ